jgi:GxxExxY protein
MSLETRKSGIKLGNTELTDRIHRLDLVVERKVIVELKAISALEDIHYAIVRSYLRAANLADALLLNFARSRLTVKRVGREYQPKLEGEDVNL